MIVYLVVYAAIIAVLVVSWWKIFEKAGKPGWAAIVPVYNLVVMMEIINRPVWWVVLYFVPCVNIVIAAIVAMDLGEAFGKTKGWGFGLLFLVGIVGFPMLAFGSDSYKGAPARA